LRPVVNDDLMREAAGHLTERDRRIIRLIARHRVFTTDQLTRLFFGNPTTARHRLTMLWRLRLLDRFRPLAPNPGAGLHAGSYCYVLDELGAWMTHIEADRDPAAFRWRRRRQGDDIAYARSQQLAHRLEVNEFFTRLRVRARHDRRVKLVRWLSETECTGYISSSLGLRPDGFGQWRQDGREVGFWLEWDRGTEPLNVLRDKLERYGDLENATLVKRQYVNWVLICVPSTRRERHLRQNLSDCRAPVATGVLAPGMTPDEPIWWPLTLPDEDGVRLVELEDAPLPPALVRSVREELEHERWRQEHAPGVASLSSDQIDAIATYLDQHDPGETTCT
jgi:hypothetical protein